ncbi:TPM domain-containing protein, partial [Nonomuraea sp. RK-328]|nr:TPM domain-containing protein [Nonomuraea sp. RK-328]
MRGLSTAQADDVRQALRAAERRSGLRFGLFLGPPAGGRRHFAERLHAALGEEAPDAVVVLVDVTGRALEIVTGERARRRLPDGSCRLTAMSMATAFGAGDLVGGLLYGIAALGEQAATARR